MSRAEPYELAMFPLGLVLFPSEVLPLHVFEPRYRAMLEHLTRDDLADGQGAEFGVVLIERGSDVGGGETRTQIGTVAGILQAEQFDDGRWGLVTVGLRRCRIVEWLADDPWPRARVVDWPDADADAAVPDLPERYTTLIGDMRRLLALAAELGDVAADATSPLSDDPRLGSFQLSAIGPFGPADQQRLLSLETTAARIEAVATMIEDHRELLDHRLRLATDDDPPPGLS